MSQLSRRSRAPCARGCCRAAPGRVRSPRARQSHVRHTSGAYCRSRFVSLQDFEFFFLPRGANWALCEELVSADVWSALAAQGLRIEFGTRRPFMTSRRRRSRWCPPRRRPTDRRPSRPARAPLQPWKPTGKECLIFKQSPTYISNTELPRILGKTQGPWRGGVGSPLFPTSPAL